MVQWKKVRIQDIGTVVGGATPSTKIDANYKNGHISWITPKDLSTFEGRYIYTGERNITEMGLNSSSTVLMPKNSILFSSRAPIGYVAIAGKELCTNQGFKSVIPNKKIDYLFLYYLLKYNKNKIENLGSGTTFKEVSGSVMKNVEVMIPEDIKEQKRIAAVLNSIDDKIELNNEINDNLYDQIKKYFIHLFIENEQSVSWEKKNIGYLVEKTIGGDWGKEASTGNYTEKVYCIRGADIPDIKYGNKGKMPIRFILPKNYTNKKLNSGDLVVEISGGSPTQSTGRVAFISNSLLNQFNNGLVCTNFCRAVTPKNEWSLFLYTLWQYLYDKDLFFTYENGTTGIKNFDLTGFLDNEEFSVPPMELLRKFNNLCVSSLELIFENGIENERLANIRDSLLPKLMSGEIDVDSIEL